MKILFRADGNAQIGSGHIMRTLSIAAKLRERGADCAFVSADDNAAALIAGAGFRHIVLHTEYRDMPSELPKLMRLLDEEQPDWLLADGYYVTHEYLSQLRRRVRLAYIDDVDAFVYPVDCLINYNVSAGDAGYAKRYPPDTALLLGMDYAPLREEFRDIVPAIPPEARDLLLLTGGADPHGFGASLLNALLARALPDNVRLHIVVGALNPHAGEIMEIANAHVQVVVHRSVTHMAELMRMCDAAVSASGSTLYELCACGVPTVCYTDADNQVPLADGFTKRGIMQYAGDTRVDARETVAAAASLVNALLDDSEMRNAYSEKMRACVDGLGTERLADFFLRG